jgi:hypothetical protein
VQRFAAVEIADPTDSGVVVAGAVWVSAAHPADGDVFEDGPGAERCRCGRNAGVARRGKDDVAVVPEREELRHGPVDVDIAVAGRSSFAGDGVGEHG